MQQIPNDQNKNNVVATGRFTFHKKNLYYSFYISDKAARPRSLQFVDSEGTILEEHTLSGTGGLVTSLYQNAGKYVVYGGAYHVTTDGCLKTNACSLS